MTFFNLKSIVPPKRLIPPLCGTRTIDRKNTSERKQQAKKILNKQKENNFCLRRWKRKLVTRKRNAYKKCNGMSYAAYISSALFVISWAGVRPGDAPILYASVGRIYANMSFVFKYIHEAEVYTIPQPDITLPCAQCELWSSCSSFSRIESSCTINLFSFIKSGCF